MNIGEFESTKKNIYYICLSWNVPYQDIDECVQWVFLKRLEGKNRKQLLDHSVIDWMRSYYVSSRLKDWENAYKFRNARQFNPRKDGAKTTLYNNNEGFFDLLEHLPKKKDKEIIYKYFFVGQYLKEIAKDYDVTLQTISIRIARILRDLKKILSAL